MSERDFVAEATADGWAPKEDWRGDEDKWVDAKTFVEKGEKSAGILRSKVDRMSGQIESLLSTNKEFKEFTDAQLAKVKEENAKLLTKLKAQRKTAVTDGDGEAFEVADAKINEIEAEKPQELDKKAYDALANAWLNENPWYNTDEDLHIYADGLAGKINSDGFSGKAYFDELTRRMKEKYPEKLGVKKKAQTVESGGDIEVVDTKARNYENLPKDAKDACDRFVKDIPGFKKADFVSTYDWE